MAESILYNVVGDIVMKLTSEAFTQARIWREAGGEFEKLKRTMSLLQAVLADAERSHTESNQVNELLRQMKEVVYEVDDLLDDISVHSLSSKTVCFYLSNPTQLLTSHNLFNKMKCLRNRLDEIAGSKNFLLPVEPSQAPKIRIFLDREQSHSSIPEIVVGRDDDKMAIINHMFGPHGEDVAVIPIVGIGGQGKTTLAQLVYNDAVIARCFSVRIWVCVSVNFDVKLIVEKMLESVTRKKRKNLDMTPLKDLLQEQINGKRYLIVLDDVWCDDDDRWSRLMALLKGGARGSRVIVTTRSQRIARMTRSERTHELKALSEDDSWELFKQLAFQHGKAPSELHEKIGKEILAKCSGVPLAIKATGRVMYFEESLVELQSYCAKVLANVDGDILPILKLSYDHLPLHLKRCFAYCGLFPKEHVIRVPLLVNLWMAHGFILQDEMPEDTGLKYFKDLLSRSLFQEPEEDEWGNLVACKMHDLIHDLAVDIAGKEILVSPDTNEAFDSSRIRHLSFYRSNMGKLWPDLSKATSLRTLILLDEPEQIGHLVYRVNKGQRDLKLSSFSHLRVMDLHGLTIGKLPCSIAELKLLRYLDLSDNQDLKTLPESVTELLFLQTLRLDRCSSLVELPNGTRRLTNLARLGLDACHCLTHMPSGLGKLTSLCSLSRFVVANANGSNSKSKGTLEELGCLKYLKGSLEIINLHYIKRASECKAANLHEKSRLQNVSLHWDRKNMNNVGGIETLDEEALEALQPHRNLKGLNVMGYAGHKFPPWISSLDNLTLVTLSNCQNLRDLPPLHRLPNLKELIVEGLEGLKFVDTEKFSSSEVNGTVFFPSLKKLQIWRCPNLKGWWNRHSIRVDWRFSLLKEMTIGYCPNMTSFPLIPPLKSVVLWDTDMKSLESMVSGETVEEQQLSPSSMQLQYLQIGSINDLYRIHENIYPRLTNLRTLAIADCPLLVTLDDALGQMPFLEELWIWGCPNLEMAEDACVENVKWSWPTCLRSIFLRDIHKLKSLPWWIEFNSSLQDLHIWDCLSLVRPPPWMTNLKELRLLDICRCSQLSECLKTSSEDRNIIAHIRNIKIDGDFNQLEGIPEVIVEIRDEYSLFCRCAGPPVKITTQGNREEELKEDGAEEPVVQLPTSLEESQ